MQKYTIMVIDDEYQERASLYEAFFEKEYVEIGIQFAIHPVEYGRDLHAKLRQQYMKIDAFFIDARLDKSEKGWGADFDVTFDTVLSQIEKVYSGICIPPIFMMSKHWQDDYGLLSKINRAFSVFHNPLQASRYYSQEELETVIKEAQTSDRNGVLILNTLRSEREYIASEILKTRSVRYNSSTPVDVVLQLAVPDEKRRAYQILNLSEADDQYLKPYGLSYQETHYDGHHIVVVPQAAMGMTEASRTATASILAFRPRLIAMTGICAGKKGHTNLCDLVVANYTFDYTMGKLLKDTLEHRPQFQTLSAELSSFVSNNLVNNADSLFADVNKKYTGDAPSGCRIHFTSMGSGPWVVDNPQIFEEIREHIVGNCMALDMEAYAVAAVANQMKTPWLVLKSVQDYANGKKQDTEKKSRAYAAFSSTYILCQQLSKLMEYIK